MMAGFKPLNHSQVMPSRSRLPGPRFSTTTSAFGTMRANSSLPCGSRRLSVTLRLLAFRMMKYQASGPFGSAPRPRPGSPPLGCSILITLAPSQASIWVHEVPASNWVRSRTVTLASGLGICCLPALRRAAAGREPAGRAAPPGPRARGAIPPHHSAIRTRRRDIETAQSLSSEYQSSHRRRPWSTRSDQPRDRLPGRAAAAGQRAVALHAHRAVSQGGRCRGAHGAGGVELAQPIEQHGAGEDRRQRVRPIAAGETGRGSVDRLEVGAAFADVAGGTEAEAADRRAAQVAEDVAQEVLADNHVEGVRLEYERLSRRIGVAAFEDDFRILRAHRFDHGAEEGEAAQHVGLVHTGDAAHAVA